MQLGDLSYLNKLEEIQGLLTPGRDSSLYVVENPTMTALNLLNLRNILDGSVVVSFRTSTQVFPFFFQKKIYISIHDTIHKIHTLVLDKIRARLLRAKFLRIFYLLRK